MCSVVQMIFGLISGKDCSSVTSCRYGRKTWTIIKAMNAKIEAAEIFVLQANVETVVEGIAD